MKVLVVGATGKIGRKTLAALLDQGHQVTAFGRSVGRIPSDPGLKIVRGDATDPDALLQAVTGQDAVILTFGAPLNRRTILFGTDLCETATRAVVDVMQQAGVTRLIAMTSIGAGDSARHGRWVFRNLIKPVLLSRIMRDRTAQEAVVRGSGLAEWVIVRPAELTDGSEQTDLRTFTEFAGGPEPTTISRASVAAFLARMVQDKTHDKRAVLISD